MEIRPYRGSDEAELLKVWRAAMFADGRSEAVEPDDVRLLENRAVVERDAGRALHVPQKQTVTGLRVIASHLHVA